MRFSLKLHVSYISCSKSVMKTRTVFVEILKMLHIEILLIFFCFVTQTNAQSMLHVVNKLLINVVSNFRIFKDLRKN